MGDAGDLEDAGGVWDAWDAWPVWEHGLYWTRKAGSKQQTLDFVPNMHSYPFCRA